MTWVSGALAVGCLAVGVLHLLRLGVRRLDGSGGDMTGEASYAAMGLGMGAMFSPVGDPVPDLMWTVVFALCGAWFAARALRAGSMDGDVGHHVVGSVAMLFMVLTGHSHAAGGSGHAGHLAEGAGPVGPGVGSVVAIVLAGYFAWHALRCNDRLRAHADDVAGSASAGVGAPVVSNVVDASVPTGTAPVGGGSVGTAVAVPARPTALWLRAARTATAAHLVMAVAMTVMLLAAV